MAVDFHAAYDPAQLTSLCNEAVAAIAAHLRSALDGKVPVSPAIEPDEALRRWKGAAAPLQDSFRDLLDRVLADSAALHHPRWVGHQVAPPLPAAVVADLLASHLNNGMAIYDIGPAAAAIERACVRWMADKVSYPATADGVFTSGGTLANLTALLAMRQRASRGRAWRDGGGGMTVLASAHAHYSVDRAVRIMGWGERGVTPVETDQALRIRPEALPRALAQAREEGLAVVGVVASSCNTPAGTFDPLEPIADFCAREGLLLHVDGAHGAAAALSPKYAHLVKGIDRSDSLVWDAHKLLLAPATTSAVLHRDASLGYEAFPQEASYLFEGAGAHDWKDIGRRTLECTKRMTALRLYLPLKLHGEAFFAACVERQFDLARDFARLLAEQPDFELFCTPESNIVCWRHRPSWASQETLDDLQDAVRETINRSGEFYLTRTRLPSGVHLRSALMHPLTTLEDLAALVQRIRWEAEALREGRPGASAGACAQ